MTQQSGDCNNGTQLRIIDINCDMGEGMPNDAALMPFISSANIACGYHAGDENSMYKTIVLAQRNNVKIGAHVSFPDRDNFGRSEMHLPEKEIVNLVADQLSVLSRLAKEAGSILTHVKPHGALYNMSAREPRLAHTIALAVKTFDPNLILFGLSKSHAVIEAARLGLKVFQEAFADRTYQDDGSLTPRSAQAALIHDSVKASEQVIKIICEGMAQTVSGKLIPVPADTICIHGDGPHALQHATAIFEILENNNIQLAKIKSHKP